MCWRGRGRAWESECVLRRLGKCYRDYLRDCGHTMEDEEARETMGRLGMDVVDAWESGKVLGTLGTSNLHFSI